MAEILDTISSIPLFSGLPQDQLHDLALIAVKKGFNKGQLVFSEGDEADGFYVVLDGLVKIFKLSIEGKEHILHFAHAGMTFAEVAAIGQFNCPAHAEVTEDSVCVLLPRVEFRRIVNEDHGFCVELMTGMSKWVHQLVGLLEDLVLRDATARVARHLIKSDDTRGRGEFTLPMRKKDLASHLNLTSETLSRTLNRLVDCGLIETHAQRIRISDVDKLQEVARGMAPAEFD